MLGERDREDLNNTSFEDDSKDNKKKESSIARASLLRVLRIAIVDNF